MNQTILKMKYLRKRSSKLKDVLNGFISEYVSGETSFKYYIYPIVTHRF